MIILRPDHTTIDLWTSPGEEATRFAAEEYRQAVLASPAGEPVLLIHPVGGADVNAAIVNLQDFTTERLRHTIPWLPEWNQLSCNIAEELKRMAPARKILVAFDDFLYRDLPESTRLYALPQQFLTEPYRRHGNDGLAHSWAALQNQNAGALVTIHLANRSTLCGFTEGKIAATGCGYSPLDGLPGRGTCGKIDPSLAMMLSEKLGIEAATRLLTQESGWMAIAESKDFADVLASNAPGDSLARGMWTNELLKAIGAICAHLNGMEQLYLFGEAPALLEQTARLLRERLPYTGGMVLSTCCTTPGKIYTELALTLLNGRG